MDNDHETCDEATAGVFTTTTTTTTTAAVSGGEKNSLWFRYVVISISVFTSRTTSTSLEEDHDRGDDDDEPTTTDEHVIEINPSSRWERVVRIVDEKDLMALRRHGGVDLVVSLQRSHFEVRQSF
ncbi:hypothetical protein TIFTF001_001783 [Ficus carica]|uniref:Uncharacterized protein n=1 Tax=Ficus carica TaxID=3494 RepID=A0AA87Z1L2_FICCA|nr:hypothetical protein TIFTF001_001783 [Ficus carica]